MRRFLMFLLALLLVVLPAAAEKSKSSLRDIPTAAICQAVLPS